MIPEGMYKRRHFDTPASFTLIIVNIITMGVLVSFFPHHSTNWFFWTVLGLLAAYNIYDIYKNREVYTRINVIAYVITLIILVVMYIFM